MSEQLEKDCSEFIQWRNEVACELCLDSFDLCLTWFSAKGYQHEQVLFMAKGYELAINGLINKDEATVNYIKERLNKCLER